MRGPGRGSIFKTDSTITKVLYFSMGMGDTDEEREAYLLHALNAMKERLQQPRCEAVEAAPPAPASKAKRNGRGALMFPTKGA